MTLKPPTRTLPKLVMKEWPEPLYPVRQLNNVERELGKNWDTPNGRKALIARVNGVLHVNGEPAPDDPFNYANNPLSDFTRVLEGVEGQKEAPLRKGDHE